MFKGLILALSMIVSLHASAATDINTVFSDSTRAILAAPLAGPNWKVGDTASYKLNIASFINGTMVMTIKALTDSEMTMGQDADLGFAGKQSCDVLIDIHNGKVKKMTCNGQDQTPAEGANDIEIVETKEDHITVPAGAFDCIYIKAKQKSDGKEIEQWINPKLVPVTGAIKMIAPTQLGAMTVELTSYKKM